MGMRLYKFSYDMGMRPYKLSYDKGMRPYKFSYDMGMRPYDMSEEVILVEHASGSILQARTMLAWDCLGMASVVYW